MLASQTLLSSRDSGFGKWQVNWETKTLSPVTRQKRRGDVGYLNLSPRVCSSMEYTSQVMWPFQMYLKTIINLGKFGGVNLNQGRLGWVYYCLLVSSIGILKGGRYINKRVNYPI